MTGGRGFIALAANIAGGWTARRRLHRLALFRLRGRPAASRPETRPHRAALGDIPRLSLCGDDTRRRRAREAIEASLRGGQGLQGGGRRRIGDPDDSGIHAAAGRRSRISNRRFRYETISSLALAAFALILGLGGLAHGAGAQDRPFVAMTTDANGLGDGSFNDGVWAGLKKAEADGLAPVKVLEAHAMTDYVPNLSGLAEDGAKLVFGVGFLMVDQIQEAAKANPKTFYAGYRPLLRRRHPREPHRRIVQGAGGGLSRRHSRGVHDPEVREGLSAPQ